MNMTMRPRINNRKMNALRRELVYEAVMTDLYLIGAISKETVEQLTGRKLDGTLTSPIAAKTDVQ